ncbi:hypothetical protein N0V84_008440 [Fusarium piperis]|uniref:Uncharacterized protein n=1 Tax=Fusarium piperis TaxID=1435070 RepID=A0A9W9BLX9_9HYPO|nr:hypothetical protein N0V84_008440 [Fusarium piperis]
MWSVLISSFFAQPSFRKHYGEFGYRKVLWFGPESFWYFVRTKSHDEAEKSVTRLGSASKCVNAKLTVAIMIHINEIEKPIDQGTSYIDCFRGVDLRRTEIACMAFAT